MAKRRGERNRFNVPIRTDKEQDSVEQTFAAVEGPVEKVVEPSVMSPAKSAKVVHIVTKTLMNFRKGPSVNSPIIKIASKGEKFRLLDHEGEWVKVETLQDPHEVGYLRTDFVQEV